MRQDFEEFFESIGSNEFDAVDNEAFVGRVLCFQ